MSQTIDEAVVRNPETPLAAGSAPPGLMSYLAKSGRRMAIGAVAGALILGGTRLLMPHNYTASALLLFPSTAASGRLGGLLSAAGGGGGNDQPEVPLLQGLLTIPQPGTSPETAALILNSRKMALKLVDRLSLEQKWGLSRSDAADWLAQNLICTPGDSGDLKIALTDRPAREAYEIVQSAIDELYSTTDELNLNPAGRNVRFLQSQVAQARSAFNAALAALTRYQQRIGAVPPDQQVQLYVQVYPTVKDELTKAEIDARQNRLAAQQLTQAAERMLKMAVDPTAGLQPGLLTNLYAQSVQQQTQLLTLTHKFGPAHPDVVMARHALREIQRQVKAEVERQMRGISSGAHPFIAQTVATALSSQAAADSLSNVMRDLQSRIARLPEREARYAKLSLDVEAQKARLTGLVSELDKAQIMADKRGPDIVVLDPPTVPAKPNSRRGALYAFLGCAAGLVLAGIKPYRAWSLAALTREELPTES